MKEPKKRIALLGLISGFIFLTGGIAFIWVLGMEWGRNNFLIAFILFLILASFTCSVLCFKSALSLWRRR